MSASCIAAFALALCGQAKITGFTYSCPAPFLGPQYVDTTGNRLSDGKIGRNETVIYQHAGNPVISVNLPGPCRVDRVVAHCHRHNDNYKCSTVRLYAQAGGLWVQVDEKPGFLETFAPQHADVDIELEAKGMTTEALRVVFLAASILSISELEVLGAPVASQAQQAPTAWAQTAPPAQAAVRELDGDGDGKLDLALENPWLRLLVSPARGGVVRSLIYNPVSTDLVCAEGSNFGLLREQLWKPQYFLADNPCTVERGTSKGSAWIETHITGAGGMMAFTHTRKRITLYDSSSVAEVQWNLTNDPSSMTEYEYGLWMHNWTGIPGAETRYFVPTVEGVQEFVLRPGEIKEQVDLWYREPARGWIGLVGEPPGQEGATVGLALLVPYENLACFYHWAGLSSWAATVEWRHGLVKLAAGESFKTRYLLVPFSGLTRVDGVCALTAPEAPGAPAAVVGSVDAQRKDGRLSAQVTVFATPGAPRASAVAASRTYPEGQTQELAHKDLKPGETTEVFAGDIPGTSEQPVLVSCRILMGETVVDEFERLFTPNGTRVAYRLEPREKRAARVESEQTEVLPRHDLQRSVVTPHVPWARPLAGGPIQALVLCDDENAREVVELAQRLDVDFTYIKFRTNRETEWIYQGDRTVPTLEMAQRRLLEALEKPFDVALIAGFDWQVHFTPEIRSKLAEKVQAGMGLVAIEPCGVPSDDPLVDVLGVSEQDRPLGRFFTWKCSDRSEIGRGLPWPWEGKETFSGLMPRTRRMEYSRWPSGTVAAFYEEDGKPLLCLNEVGRGRVVTATYDVLTHAMSYRGFSGLTPIISYRGKLLLDEYERMTWPYWEHWWVLLTHTTVWAARREAPVQIAEPRAEINGEGQVVVHLKAVGEARAPIFATLQLIDRYGAVTTTGAQANTPQARALQQGLWNPELFRGAESPDDLSYLSFGTQDVAVGADGEVSVRIGRARAGWNFVRVVLRDAATRAALDWAVIPVQFSTPPLAIKSLEVDRDPVTDCQMLVDQSQPWARAFIPEKPLLLTVQHAGVLPLEPDWRLRAELYDNHGRLLFAEEKPVEELAEPLQFTCAPTELRNMGLEWRATLLRGEGEATQVLDTARRRLIAQPPRVWDRFTFTSWASNFLTRSFWLHQYLVPFVEEVGVDVGMDSVSELGSGKVYRNKWHNIDHSYIGLLDYPGPGIPGFRDAKFAEKSAKYPQTKDKALLVREPCLNDPEYRSKLSDALRDRVREAAKVGLSYDYCMGDEMSLTHYTQYYDYCFSDYTLAAFREWLKHEYPGVEDLNRAWGTDYASWDQVMPMTLDEVRGRANAAPWAEFRTFMNDNLADFYAFVQKTIREVDLEAKCGLSGTQEPKPGNGMDWWKLSRAFSYYHSYNTGWSNEMRRSFAAETGVRQTPYYAGYWQGGRRLEYNMMWCLLHDTKGISCWTTPLLVYPDFTLTEAGEDTRRLVHELRDGLWDAVRAGRRLQDGIALHYSQPSINAALLLDHDSHIVQVRDAWVKLLEDLGLQYDFVAYKQVEAGALTRTPGCYRVFILPESIALSAREVDEIRRFVTAGGTVIADGWCGLMDERCVRHERPALDEVFGVSRGEEVALGESVKVSARVAGKETVLRIRPAETGVRTTGIPFGDSGGVPALVSSKMGKGQTWYLNLDLSSWPVDRQTRSPNEQGLRDVVGNVLASAGVRPPLRVTCASGKPAHVEVVRYELGGSGAGRDVVVGLLRNWDQEGNDIITASWGTERHVYDLRAHKYLGKLGSVTTPMAAGECRLLFLTVTEINAPILVLEPAKVLPGGTVRAIVRSGNSGAAPHLARLEVIGPAGVPVPDYARSLRLQGQPIDVNFRLALNDPKGRWLVRVTDLASGQTAQQAFTVGP